MTFVLLAGLAYTAVALLSRTLLQNRPGAARTVSLASAAIMVVLGAVLLGEQLLPLSSGARLGSPEVARELVVAELLPVLFPNPAHLLVLADGNGCCDLPLRHRVLVPPSPVPRIE